MLHGPANQEETELGSELPRHGPPGGSVWLQGIQGGEGTAQQHQAGEEGWHM